MAKSALAGTFRAPGLQEARTGAEWKAPSLKLPPDQNLKGIACDFRKGAARLCRIEDGLRVRRSRLVKKKSMEKAIASLEARKEETRAKCQKQAEELGEYEKADVLLRLRPRDRTMAQVVGLIIGVGLVRVAEAVFLASSGYGATIAVSAFVVTYLAWRALLQYIIQKSSHGKPGKDPIIEIFSQLSRDGNGATQQNGENG